MDHSLEDLTKYDVLVRGVGNYRQELAHMCGVAALKTVLDWLGRDVPISELVKLTNTTKKAGTSPNNLCIGASKLGLRTFQQTNATTSEIENYLKARIPIIVDYQSDDGGELEIKDDTWDEGHYSVIIGANKNEFLLSDPAKKTGGYRPIKKDLFIKYWRDKDYDGRVFNRWFMAVFPRSIPFVSASGDNYEIGFAIGKGCKEDIEVMLRYIRNDFEQKTKKSFSSFIDASRKFLQYCKDAYSEYVREIRGMANGAGIDFDSMFALSCTEELDWNGSNLLFDKCSSIVAMVDGDAVLAHNEDYLAYPANALYIVKAKQKGKPSFLSVGYVGSLPGSSAGINSAGIAMAGNSISASDCRFGVLKNFVCRRILDETDVWNAGFRIRRTRRAVGGNYSIISSDEGLFVETTAKKCAFVPITELPAFHTNHFVSSALAGKESYVSESSRVRYAMLGKSFERLGARGISAQELKEILSDHCDWPIGICRHDYESEERVEGASTTLASIIMNPAKRTIEVASGNPCRAEYVKYEL